MPWIQVPFNIILYFLSLVEFGVEFSRMPSYNYLWISVASISNVILCSHGARFVTLAGEWAVYTVNTKNLPSNIAQGTQSLTVGLRH